MHPLFLLLAQSYEAVMGMTGDYDDNCCFPS